MVSQGIQVLPHSGMYGAVASGHGKPGFQHITVLQYIVRYQKTAFFEQTCNLRQEMNVLRLGGIHENKIVFALQFFQYFRSIATQEGDGIFLSCPFKILPGDGDTFFVFFYGGHMSARRCVFLHQKGRKSHCRSHLQNLHGAVRCHEKAKKCLGFRADNGHGIRSCFFFYLV